MGKEKKERKSSMHFRTVNGLNGIQLNKMVEFTFGERSKYDFDESKGTFVFEVRKELIKGDTAQAIKKRFEDFFRVIIEEF